MTRIIALPVSIRAAPLEVLRSLIVYGCALALILAGQSFPA